VLHATSEREIGEVFAALPQQGVEGLLIDADAFFVSRRDQLVALVARHSIPAIYDLREFAAAGGLMSYGTSLTDGYRLVGIYTGRILKGARPAELPVQQAQVVMSMAWNALYPTPFMILLWARESKTAWYVDCDFAPPQPVRSITHHSANSAISPISYGSLTSVLTASQTRRRVCAAHR
jgi:hypothetical protein